MFSLHERDVLQLQVEVGEYGKHWNFFFTLAGVAFVRGILPVSIRQIPIITAVSLVGYQALLSLGGQ